MPAKKIQTENKVNHIFEIIEKLIKQSNKEQSNELKSYCFQELKKQEEFSTTNLKDFNILISKIKSQCDGIEKMQG